MLTKLSVNLNKIALIRNSRDGNTPSVTLFGAVALKAGAAGLTVHPRPDERHIRRDDVPALSKLLKNWPGREFNIEGNPFMNLMELVREVRPDQVTFVPDSESQKTSDHGFNLMEQGEKLRPLIAEAKALGCRVSLFMIRIPNRSYLPRTLALIALSFTPKLMPLPAAQPPSARCSRNMRRRLVRPVRSVSE